jgi:NAD(P) transhydrogenase subunit alpha
VKTLVVGVPRETRADERRVALTPTMVPALAKAGIDVVVEAGAGAAAGFIDEAYRGADVATRDGVFAQAGLIAQVRTLGANRDAGRSDLALFRPDQVVVGMASPLDAPTEARELARRDVTMFALELMPRITRAQSMDVLSSQATVAGYKAVLVAAGSLPKLFPMMTTAAGTLTPARVLVIGAGVAGLQAIATARRLGAVVEAYDVRPAARDEVESLGARFVELPLQPGDAEDASGYAKALGEAFYRRQQELLAEVVAKCDAVICTALIPGVAAPVLVTADAVHGMARGSIVVDLAAEKGGNCALTVADETVVTDGGVTVLGPTNLASTVPLHASQMFAKNLAAFVLHLVRDGEVVVDPDDPIATDTLVCRGGDVVHPKVRALLREGRAA